MSNGARNDHELVARIARRKVARGLADEIVELIEVTQAPLGADAKLAFWERLAIRLPPETVAGATAEAPAVMSDAEAREFGAEAIPFGKYAGRRIDDVPLDYLVWLSEQKDTFKADLRRYIKSRRVQAEQAEAEESGDDDGAE